MILCLDAGNTRLKWGCGRAKEGGWITQGAVDHAALDDLPQQLPESPQSIIACNVAGPTLASGIEKLARALKIPLQWFVSSESACGVKNRYQQAGQLGADRWAALISARAMHRGPVVVVVAGTATTIDQLDAEGVFRGGLILPGLRLMRASLARDTANLPLVAFSGGRYCEAPDNTDDAIVSGSVHATLGAIERMRRVLNLNATVVLSGGAAGELQPHIASPVRAVENLVLDGLLYAARTQG